MKENKSISILEKTRETLKLAEQKYDQEVQEQEGIQLICPLENCSSRKMQLIKVQKINQGIRLSLLCLACGGHQLIDFDNSFSIGQNNQPNKSTPNYIN